MRFYEYEYTTFDGETKTLKLRLVSADMKTIERKTGVKLLDFATDYSINSITTMLMYMHRPSVPNFSSKDAETLYDELVDAGLTMEEIMLNIIMETLVVSGFMKKAQLDEIKTKTEESKEAELEEVVNPIKK